jgi:hypothetical protein
VKPQNDDTEAPETPSWTCHCGKEFKGSNGYTAMISHIQSEHRDD